MVKTKRGMARPKEIDMIGGQAVTEGVLMRDKERYVIAVRTKKGIRVKKENLNLFFQKNKIFRLPVIRGFFGFIDVMILGVKALTWSANQAGEEGEELTRKEFALVIGTAILMSLFLFVMLPFFLTKLVFRDNGFVFNLVDGLLRIVILVVYVWVISLSKDIRRIFEYHGAEHKVVNCYEAGVELSPRNAKGYSRIHPRCGTSFLIIILIVSVLIFSVVTDERWWVRLGLRIVLIPLIMGLSYELLKASARFRNNVFMRVMIFPGLLVQRITTQEPDNEQLRVAIRALRELID